MKQSHLQRESSPNRDFDALEDIFDNSNEESVRHLNQTKKGNVFAMPLIDKLVSRPTTTKVVNNLVVNGFREKRAAHKETEDGGQRLFEVLQTSRTNQPRSERQEEDAASSSTEKEHSMDGGLQLGNP